MHAARKSSSMDDGTRSCVQAGKFENQQVAMELSRTAAASRRRRTEHFSESFEVYPSQRPRDWFTLFKDIFDPFQLHPRLEIYNYRVVTL